MDSRNGKRASLYTLGCRLNQSETSLIRDQLQREGYTIVPFGELADLGIVNTCTVTNDADAKSRKVLRNFIRTNPHAFTAVIGCYAQMGAEALSDIEGVDVIVGNQEKLNVLDYVRAGKNAHPLIVRDRIERDDFTIDAAPAGAVSYRANLKIQDGCDFMCTFCIIPFARGRARSRALPNLLEEARRLVDNGALELVLTGVNIGTYGWQEHTVLDVVDALAAIEGLRRIRISSIEPTTVPAELFDRMADDQHPLLPYLHIPLQSGSARILQRMRRKYDPAEFIEFLQRALEAVPGIGIGTDVMVGMPGESDDDFAETIALVERAPIDYVHVFKFSEREGTAAARMDNKVPGDLKNRRSALLRRVSAQKQRRQAQRHLHEVHDVLFEFRENGYWTGYTGNYLRVAVRSNAILKNVIVPVRLDRLEGDAVVGTPMEPAILP
jgi:threonylcarbamoyladenosine tRNA methylthiotransferase MtaB